MVVPQHAATSFERLTLGPWLGRELHALETTRESSEADLPASLLRFFSKRLLLRDGIVVCWKSNTDSRAYEPETWRILKPIYSGSAKAG